MNDLTAAPVAHINNMAEITLSIQKPDSLGVIVEDKDNSALIVQIVKTATKEVKTKFQIGDKIIAVNGLRIRNRSDAQEEISTVKTGESITFTILRASSARHRESFFRTVIEGRHEEMEHILSEHPTWVNDLWEGAPAIIFATRKGDSRMVTLLLKAGAVVDLTDKDGNTALMEASKLGHAEVVEPLINAGSKIRLKNKSGDTALIEAAASGHENIVERLIRERAKLDSEGYLGYTALMQACMKGNERLVEILLNAGAKVNFRSSYGWTALILAAKYERAGVAQLLISAGANISIKGGLEKKSAVAFAPKNGQVSKILETANQQKGGSCGFSFNFLKRRTLKS